MDNNKEKTREELELEYIKFRLEGHKTPKELRKAYRDLKRQGLIQKYGMEFPLFILSEVVDLSELRGVGIIGCGTYS